MAPEVLDETLLTHHFDAYRKADIYAFGLVMWEICRRCVANGKINLYVHILMVEGFSLRKVVNN